MDKRGEDDFPVELSIGGRQHRTSASLKATSRKVPHAQREPLSAGSEVSKFVFNLPAGGCCLVVARGTLLHEVGLEVPFISLLVHSCGMFIILVMFYMFIELAGCSVDLENSRGARKLTRTPGNKKKLCLILNYYF